MSAKLLLLEDDPAIARTVAYALERDGLTVTHSLLVHDARQQLQRARFDLLVLDVGLPDGSGLDLLRDVRNAAPTAALPVLMLSAHGEEIDRVLGLELGADDYLTKPFHLFELEARVRALIRRAHSRSVSDIVHGRLRIDTAGRRIYCDERPLELTSKEFAIAELLLTRAGRVVTKQHIIDHLYGWDDPLSSNAVEVLMHRLRKKLESTGLDIRTIRGMGYLVDNAG